jgi:hypothetical protein
MSHTTPVNGRTAGRTARIVIAVALLAWVGLLSLHHPSVGTAIEAQDARAPVCSDGSNCPQHPNYDSDRPLPIDMPMAEPIATF